MEIADPFGHFDKLSDRREQLYTTQLKQRLNAGYETLLSALAIA